MITSAQVLRRNDGERRIFSHKTVINNRTRSPQARKPVEDADYRQDSALTPTLPNRGSRLSDLVGSRMKCDLRWIPMGRRELDLMLARLGLINEPVTNDPIRFVTITRENL
ncbi:hypothetical protein HJB61_27895 [Rhizobium lentis]|nr:hypothetical protein [Rhizobium lentis]